MSIAKTRKYRGKQHASCSFRIWGGPEFNGIPLVEGQYLTTEEVAKALYDEAMRWGYEAFYGVATKKKQS